MKFICLLVFTSMLAINCCGQSGVDIQVENKRKELRVAGVDTTVCYYKYFNNGSARLVIPGDTICYPEEIKYLFWRHGGQSFIQRFDECKLYSPEKVPATFMKQLSAGINKLPQEKLLNAEYTTSINGVLYKGSFSPPSHGKVVVFEIVAGKTLIDKSFMDSAIGGKYVYTDNGKKYKNLNYQKNLNTIQYKLKIIAESIVKRLYEK